MPLFSFRSLRPACFMLGVGLLVYAGCSSSGSSTVSVTHPTLIEVAPAQFLGQVPCVASGPGLKTYVATLFDRNETGSGGAPTDVTGVEEELADETTESAFARLRGEVPSDEFELPSSAPAPCNASVGFGYVVPGRRYEVLIEGYEEAREDVQARALGSHLLVSSGMDGGVLEPAYRAYCRRAIPVDKTVVVADRCDPFVSPGDAAPPALLVAVGDLLGDFACRADGGSVDFLRVTAEVGDERPSRTVPCAKDAEVVLEGLSPGIASVYVEALTGTEGAPNEAEDVALAGVTCDARLVAGAVATARCGRLSAVGTVRLDLVGALAQVDLLCSSSSITSVNVALSENESRSVFPPDCLQPLDAGLPPGEQTLGLTVTPLAGEAVSLECEASIAPGKLTLAVCEPAP